MREKKESRECLRESEETGVLDRRGGRYFGRLIAGNTVLRILPRLLEIDFGQLNKQPETLTRSLFWGGTLVGHYLLRSS